MGRSVEARIGRALYRGSRKLVRWLGGEMGAIVGGLSGGGPSRRSRRRRRIRW